MHMSDFHITARDIYGAAFSKGERRAEKSEYHRYSTINIRHNRVFFIIF